MTSVAISTDWLCQWCGAERFNLSLARAFPGAPMYTSVYYPSRTYPEYADIDVRPSRLNSFPPFRRWHRATFPLLAHEFSRQTIEADVLVAASAGFAHGMNTTGRKVVYCHTPARWLYQPPERYLGGNLAKRAILGSGRRRLRAWDERAAASADRYIASSSAVATRIHEVYGIEAEVVHPPVTLSADGPSVRPASAPDEPGFLLCVGRLIAYKNIPAVVEAFRSLPDLRLVVVGQGGLQRELARSKPGNVTLIPTVSDAELRWLYKNSSGLVAASFEDFGLTPGEAASFGKPVAALRWGGYVDTVAEGRTGVFFERPEAAHIASAVREMHGFRWDSIQLQRHAAGFGEDAFIARMQEIVSDVLSK
jgi:glycosyltransferase involved in cell wall biosynthesis